jgi:hypothetical protein
MPINPLFPGIYLQEVPEILKPIDAISTSVTGFIGKALQGPLNKATRINSLSDYDRIFGGRWKESPMSYAIEQYYNHGGKEAVVVRIGDSNDPGEADYLGDPSLKTGLHAFTDVDVLNIMVVPPPSRNTDTPPEVWRAALDLCKEKRAMLIVDPPFSVQDPSVLLTTSLITDMVPRDSHIAFYYPHLIIRDPEQGGAPDTFVASGALAGLWARIDKDRGIWKAPAGLETTLQGVESLSYTISNAENAELNKLGINCLREFSYRGKLVWGARTLEGADFLSSDYKYIPVRRLALHIEESLEKGLAWTVFEPNNHLLWKQLLLHIENFMEPLFRRGAFAGYKASDAYFIKTGLEVTSRSDINKGLVNVMVGFAPLRPAEFVIIKLQLKTKV